MNYPGCKSGNIKQKKILWNDFISEWELNPVEVEYIDTRTGLSFVSCGNNLRPMVLAKANLNHLGNIDTLSVTAVRLRYRNLRVIEINQADNLPPHLAKIQARTAQLSRAGHDEGTWDMILNSEKLECVPDKR